MKRYLRKIKYELICLMSKPKEIPNFFDKGKWKNNSSVFNLFAHTGVNLVSDLNLTDMKIFGKSYKSWIMEHDFFTKYTFNNKKLKPAYFNIADVKVPYEASRLQYLQKAKSGNIDVSSFPLIYWNSPMDVAIRNI